MLELNPICGLSLGFEFVDDEDSSYFFFYLLIVSISLRYKDHD